MVTYLSCTYVCGNTIKITKRVTGFLIKTNKQISSKAKKKNAQILFSLDDLQI